MILGKITGVIQNIGGHRYFFARPMIAGNDLIHPNIIGVCHVIYLEKNALSNMLVSGSEFTFDPNYRTHLYLIGMGYELNGKFKYEHFMVNCLTEFEEKRIIKQWISRMRSISQNREFQLIHWSNAEPSNFGILKDTLQIRGIFNWQDLKKIFDDCPGFLKENCGILKNMKLKTVAKAMKSRGYIQSDWDDEMTSGMEANMVIIRGVQRKFMKFTDFPDIEQLIYYNMIDCATLYEIVKYVRLQVE